MATTTTAVDKEGVDYLEKATEMFDLSFSCKDELEPTQLQMYAQHLEECGSEVVGAHVLANSDSTNQLLGTKSYRVYSLV